MILAAIAAAMAAGAAPGPATPHIWVAPGLYGLANSACAPGPGEPTAIVAPPFCSALSFSHLQAVRDGFVAAMAAHFPGVVANVGEGLPPDATPRARLADTLIASLTLTRATIWRIDKPVGTDAFLPITLTLDITDAATGEVVFTRTRSQIAEGTFAAAEVEGALAAQFPAKLLATMQALVAEAAANWQSRSQTATVVGRAGKAWIVDRGRSAGLTVGTAIGADGQVVYAGADYAVVAPTLGDYAIGQKLTRTIVAPAAMLARPGVLTVIGASPEGYAPRYLAGIFEEALGQHTGLAPMPVNPSFADLRSLALGEAQQLSGEARSMPDYIADIDIVTLPAAHFASNIPGVTIDRYDAHAFVSLVDRTGRVVFVAHGEGRITDKVAGEMRFSADQRRDTSVRNALIDAATKLAQFKPQSLSLPVDKAGDALTIHDPGGSLPVGVQLTVLHKIGHVSGISEPVLVPVGEVTTTVLAPDGVLASDTGVKPLSLFHDDVVAIETGGQPLASRLGVTICATSDDHRGAIVPAIWPAASAASFAGRFRGPVYRLGLPDRLRALGVEFASWEHFAPAEPPKTDRCFAPVVAVTAAGGGKYQLTAGYRLMRDGERIAGGGLQETMTPTPLPATTTSSDGAAMLQQDLADQLLPLADRAAVALLPTS